MKIAISATGSTLDTEVDPRFGRCEHFIIVDPETMEFETMDNSSAMAAGGAGISAAQTIADKDVQAVLTGNCGPNAFKVLSAAGIEVITGVSGTVNNAIESYRSGKLETSTAANVPDHFGAGATSNMGGGSDMGKGTRPAGNPMSQPESPELELQALKAHSQAMIRQLTEIQRRIDELENRMK